MMNGWGYNNMGGGAWTLMILFMIVFWVVVVVGIVAYVRRFRPAPLTSASSSPSTETPELILRARFARGEVDDTEFRARMLALKDHQ